MLEVAGSGHRSVCLNRERSLVPVCPANPVLAERARRDVVFIDEAHRHAKQFALVPLQAGSLVGQERLAALVCAA